MYFLFFKYYSSRDLVFASQEIVESFRKCVIVYDFVSTHFVINRRKKIEKNMIFIVNILHNTFLCNQIFGMFDKKQQLSLLIAIQQMFDFFLKQKINYLQYFRTWYFVGVNLKKATQRSLFFLVLFDHRCTQPGEQITKGCPNSR